METVFVFIVAFVVTYACFSFGRWLASQMIKGLVSKEHKRKERLKNILAIFKQKEEKI